jgi:hypothetical protein
MPDYTAKHRRSNVPETRTRVAELGRIGYRIIRRFDSSAPFGDLPMRFLSAMLAAAIMTSFAATQEKNEPGPNRFDVIYDPGNYPQATPQEALGSVIKALGRDRYDYLVAHLLDPAFVDDQLKSEKTTPAQLSKSVKAHMEEDPELLKLMKRFLAEGDFSAGAERVTVSLKGVDDKQVFLRKVGQRWYMENRRKEEKAVDKDRQ